jgi:FixJ family two-component response regulator
VLDVRPSREGGIALLKQVKARKNDLPVIAIGTSEGDVTFPVEAMKAGAADWLEMPLQRPTLFDTLLAAIASALAGIRRAAEQNRDTELARARIARLSSRERQVLAGLLAGGTNKVIGKTLGISPRTVELHRGNVMERLGARNLPEAVLIAVEAGIRPAFSLTKRPPR